MFLPKQFALWSIEEWLHHLEHRNGQEIQLGLTRIRIVAQKMELLAQPAQVITVTGTNGKGSTVTALETIYHQAGYKVGAYTSPHLMRFNERIRVGTLPMSDTAICAAFTAIEQAREETVLTYFEMATLAALWHFKHAQLDLIILEVGIGGRLDATNIVDADLAIITTVDFDHQDYLGSTLEAIGAEKAGILRKNTPFIFADSNPPQSILEAANQLNASTYLYGREFGFQDNEDMWVVRTVAKSVTLPKPAIQLKSAAAAIMATQLLQERLPVLDSHLAAAMQAIFIAGRLQWVRGTVDILYDVSHNPQSAQLLASTLKQSPTKQKTFAVFSALKDKDIVGLITPLKDCINRWFPAQLDNKRAASRTTLLDALRTAEIVTEICYDSPLIAFEAALNQAQPGDRIVVYGSFYTVGQVMASQVTSFEMKEIV